MDSLPKISTLKLGKETMARLKNLGVKVNESGYSSQPPGGVMVPVIDKSKLKKVKKIKNISPKKRKKRDILKSVISASKKSSVGKKISKVKVPKVYGAIKKPKSKKIY